jgi:adenosyl cobinamide kinase/adenosyl cobinamide phosphate guanylyltransferase
MKCESASRAIRLTAATPGGRLKRPWTLVGALNGLDEHETVVVDCLTLWLSNHMVADRDLTTERSTLIEAVTRCRARLWLVSNEVGWGVVPEQRWGGVFVMRRVACIKISPPSRMR